MPEPTTPDLTAFERKLPWLMALSLVIVLIPLYASPFLPSVDFMLHLGRCAVLDRQSSPFLQDLYSIRLQPIPNLGIDILVPLLAKVMSLQEAGRTFTLLTFLLEVGGAWGIMWALQRRLTPLMLIVPILCWNFILTLGFASYSFGVGLALSTIAIHLLIQGRPLWMRFAFLVVALTTTYFSHLAAFGMLALVLFAIELTSDRATPRGAELSYPATSRGARFSRLQGVIILLAAAIPSAIVQFALSPISESTGTEFGPIARRIVDFCSILNCFRGTGDFFIFVGAVIASILLWRAKAVSIDPRMRLALILSLIVFAITPWRLFGSHYTNTRMIVVFYFLLVAAWRLRPVSERTQRNIAAGALMLLFLQCGLNAERIYGWSDVNAEMDRMTSLIPEHSMLVSMENFDVHNVETRMRFPFVPIPAPTQFSDRRLQPPHSHIFDQALLRKDLFVPQLYLLPGKQPVEVHDKYYGTYLGANTMVRGPHPITKAEFDRMPRKERAAVLKEFEFDNSLYTPDNHDRIARLLPDIAREYSEAQGAPRQTFLLYRHFGDHQNPIPTVLTEIATGKYLTLYAVK